jgi:hypothetical protein
MYGYNMQNYDMAHTINFSVTVLLEVFRKWLLTRGLWPLISSDLNVCYIYLWGTLKENYVKNPHSLQEMKGNIWRVMASISRQELHLMWRNIFIRVEVCSEAGVQHFDTLTWASYSSKAPIIAAMSSNMIRSSFYNI